MIYFQANKNCDPSEETVIDRVVSMTLTKG